MTKNFKRFLAILLAVSMILSSQAVTFAAEEIGAASSEAMAAEEGGGEEDEYVEEETYSDDDASLDEASSEASSSSEEYVEAGSGSDSGSDEYVEEADEYVEEDEYIEETPEPTEEPEYEPTETPAADAEPTDLPDEAVDAEPTETPDDDVDAEPTETPVVTEAPVAEEMTRTEYKQRDAAETVEVIATIEKANAVPDDAELFVAPVLKDSVYYDYDAYMNALNDSVEDAAPYTENNTLLYDIGFLVEEKDAEGNPTGNKVEFQPEDGSVTVKINFLNGQLSEELGAETSADVEIVHLPLVSDVIENVTSTADAGTLSPEDIVVEVIEENVNIDLDSEEVEFKSDNFSVFAVKVDEGNAVSFSFDGVTGDDISAGDNLYLRAKVSKNGNTHYWARQISSLSDVIAISSGTYFYDTTGETNIALSKGDNVYVELVKKADMTIPSPAGTNADEAKVLVSGDSIGNYYLSSVIPNQEENTYVAKLTKENEKINDIEVPIIEGTFRDDETFYTGRGGEFGELGEFGLVGFSDINIETHTNR